ncbi:kynureninase-like, partial [Stegodyphus dumicola]|uniref:kynureninase-like n=1 Tax=Stegodyphus dumicola TaxID=202533 RepID=UPI0015B30CC4
EIKPFYTLLQSSFYQPTEERHKILMVDNGFHSDLYAVQSHIKLRGYDPKESIIFLKPGCVVGFDLAHAVGNVKLQLHEWEVDFALWCTYKYLNSGAGSMGCIYVHERHTNGYNEIIPMMQGWWGVSNAEKFSLQREFIPADGADRFKISNPSPFLSAMVLVNLEVFREAGIERLQEKQKLLTGYLEYLLKKHFPPSNGIESGKPHIQVITPSNPKRRGCQISIMSSRPITEIDERLKAKGIVCDMRKPSVLRVTPAPLYNSFTEVYKFVHILEEVVDEISWQNGQQN